MSQSTSSPNLLEQKIWQEEKRFLMRVYAMRLVQKLEGGEETNAQSIRSLQIARTYAGRKLVARIDALLSAVGADVEIPADEEDSLASIGRAVTDDGFASKEDGATNDSEDMDLFDDEEEESFPLDEDEDGKSGDLFDRDIEDEDDDEGIDGLFEDGDDEEESESLFEQDTEDEEDQDESESLFEQDIDEEEEDESESLFEQDIDEEEEESDRLFEQDIDEEEEESDRLFEQDIDEEEDDESDRLFEQDIDEEEDESNSLFEQDADESDEGAELLAHSKMDAEDLDAENDATNRTKVAGAANPKAARRKERTSKEPPPLDDKGQSEEGQGDSPDEEEDEDAGVLFEQDIYSGNSGARRPGTKDKESPGVDPTKGHEQQNTPGFDPTEGHEQQDTPGFKPTKGHEQQNTPGFDPTEGHEQQDTPGFDPTKGHEQQDTPGFDPTTGHEQQDTPGFDPTTGHEQQNTPGFKPTKGHEQQDTPGFDPTEGHEQQNTPGFKPTKGHEQQDTPGFDPTEGHEQQNTPGFDPTEGHEQQDTPGFVAQDVEKKESVIGKKRPVVDAPAPESKIGRRQEMSEEESGEGDKPSRLSARERMAKAKEELERRKKTREAQLKAREEETENSEEEGTNAEELLANLTHHIELVDLEQKLGIQIIPEDRLRLDRQLAKKMREPCIQSLLATAKNEDLSLVMLPRLFRFIREGQLFKVTGANLLRSYPQLFENIQQVALKLRTEPFFVQESPELDWIFTTTEILPDSRDKTYMQQKQALKQHAHNQQANERRVRRRNLVDALYDLIAVNAVADINMLSATVDLTESRIGRQNLAFINFGENGIRISDISRQQTHPQLGVCPSW